MTVEQSNPYKASKAPLKDSEKRKPRNLAEHIMNMARNPTYYYVCGLLTLSCCGLYLFLQYLMRLPP